MSDLIKGLNAKFEKMNEQMTAIREQMRSESKGFIEQACAEMFEKCPEVHQIHWTQYSPYFNDGEECSFSVNEISYVLTCDLNEDGEWEEGFYDGSRIYTNDDIKNAERDLRNAIEFTADPEAWRRKRYGDVAYDKALQKEATKSNGWMIHRTPYELTAKPYPSDPDKARRALDKVKAAVESMEGRSEIIEEYVYGVINLIQKIDSDVMESLFGNHISVIVDRNGMHIDEYNHD